MIPWKNDSHTVSVDWISIDGSDIIYFYIQFSNFL